MYISVLHVSQLCKYFLKSVSCAILLSWYLFFLLFQIQNQIVQYIYVFFFLLGDSTLHKNSFVCMRTIHVKLVLLKKVWSIKVSLYF